MDLFTVGIIGVVVAVLVSLAVDVDEFAGKTFTWLSTGYKNK